MSLNAKIKFWSLKLSRLAYYNIRYRINKCIKIEGILFPVELNYGYGVLRFIDNGEYESGEINIIKNTLQHDDKVLELGTGLGFISAYCAKKIGSENVYTFEANPGLKKSIDNLYHKNDVNPNLEFSILGKENKVVSFYVNKESLLGSGQQDSFVKKQRIEVEQKNLNEKIRDITPTYLIMDIEGGEHDIINEIDFQTIRKVQFELHPRALDSEKVAQIFEKLGRNGFKRDASFNSGITIIFLKLRLDIPGTDLSLMCNGH